MTHEVEAGDVFFFYRPRVGTYEVEGLEDVQRFYTVLKPNGEQRFRVLVVGAKRLPDVARRERGWAFVSEVTETQPEARPVGAGRYAIVLHDDHTHLAYWLEDPREPGWAQELFNVEREASYIVAVKNPDAPTPPGVGLRDDRRADFPPRLLERFGGRRYAPVDTPELLDYEGAELILVGASEDVSRELGVHLDADDERAQSGDILEKGALR
jgi:hypothetical protein